MTDGLKKYSPPFPLPASLYILIYHFLPVVVGRSVAALQHPRSG